MKNFFSINIFIILLNSLTIIQSELLTIKNVQINWTYGEFKTDFIIKSQLASELNLNNAWIGIGFNKIRDMNDANVVMCKSKANQSSIEHYYNINDYSSPLLSTNLSIGLTNSKVEVTNGYLVCSFTRDNTINVSNYYNLKNQNSVYIITAYGSFSSNGQVQQHILEGESFAPIDLTQSIVSYPVVTSIGNVNINWTYKTFQTDFVVSSPLGNGLSLSNSWLSFGFNSLQQMNGAVVVICKSKGSDSTIEHYFNSFYRSTVLSSVRPSIGITNVKVEIINSNLVCSFTRDNLVSIIPNYFNFTTSTNSYIISAYGPYSSTGDIARHSFKGELSSKIFFYQSNPFSTTTKKSTMNQTIIELIKNWFLSLFSWFKW